MGGIGIGLPQGVRATGDGAALRRFVTGAEAAGFESAWVVETTRPGVIDPLAALTFAAAHTSRIRLGTAILLSALRSPVRLAHEVASVDRLSEGRVVVGVGLGNGPRPYPWHGLPAAHRAQRFEAGVRTLRALLSCAEITSHEPGWRLERFVRPLEPVQKPTPPIWIGARTRPALDRAVRLADGWVGAGSSTVAAFTEALTIIRERLDAHGRDPATFEIAKRVYIHVATPTPAVTAMVGEWYATTYGPVDDVNNVVVIGEPRHCAERIGELRELGARTLILHPVRDEYEQMVRLASDVVPALG